MKSLTVGVDDSFVVDAELSLFMHKMYPDVLTQLAIIHEKPRLDVCKFECLHAATTAPANIKQKNARRIASGRFPRATQSQINSTRLATFRDTIIMDTELVCRDAIPVTSIAQKKIPVVSEIHFVTTVCAGMGGK